MEKEKIKKILEEHMEVLSKISKDENKLISDPVLLTVVTESMKTTSLTLFFLDKF